MMAKTLVESVPNISEGRDSAVIDKLATGLEAVSHVALLDVHVDPDHHRSVFTVIGEPEAMEIALYGLVRDAQRLIDIRKHHGEHPRVGVVDVVPWIPMREVTIEDCIIRANALGVRIGKELGIPVFLYGEAGVTPSRRKLAVIRRGGLTALERRMSTDLQWQPDYGPSTIHPTAGAIAVGARFFLIAFNVVLKSSDLDAARQIATIIRTSSGGLPSLQAIGVPLSSRKLVQVSMNLTDFRETSLRRAFEAVEGEARRHAIEILESEIVGLLPQAAWDENLTRDLKLLPRPSDPIIEYRLEQSTFFRSY